MSPCLASRKLYLVVLGLVVVALFVGLVSCRAVATEAITVTVGPAGPTVPGETAPPTPTDTLPPSPTAPPPLVILLLPPGVDAEQATAVQSVMTELAAQDGMRFETHTDLQAAQLESGVRLVVSIASDAGLADLAAANPEVQFLALSIPQLQASANISTIASQGDRPDRQGFLAGYLSAVITQDWRVGVISRGDIAAGQAARLGFLNGVVFFCGLCRPAYPPFYEYPVYAELPGDASQADQQAAADVLIANAVETVYVFPGAGDESLLTYLSQAEINIIGGVTPPAAVQNRWVASIRTDWAAAIKQAWSMLIEDQGGFALDAPLVITDRNESLFSPGRQRLVEKLLADLSAGYIDTGVDPLTGEPQ